MISLPLLSAFFFVFSSAQPGLAHTTPAAFIPIYFGTQDTIIDLQPVEGTKYVLAHKHHAYYLFGGLYLKDDGYVLKESITRGTYSSVFQPTKYIPLTPEKTRELQQEGVLPDPLPTYKIPFGAYVSGYSLWGFFLLVAAYLMVRMVILRMWERYVAPEP